MKTTLEIDDALLREAMSASGNKTKTDTVAAGLRELIRRHQLEQLANLGGRVRQIKAPRRRRP